MRKTCKCGQQFDADDGRQRLCPACKEARDNARFPAKPCEKCGKVTQDLFQRRRVCGECYQARRGKSVQPVKVKHTEPQRDDFLTWLGQQSAELQHAILLELRAICVEMGIDVDTRKAVEPAVNPEEVPHANQAAIDAQFATIMADMHIGDVTPLRSLREEYLAFHRTLPPDRQQAHQRIAMRYVFALMRDRSRADALLIQDCAAEGIDVAGVTVADLPAKDAASWLLLRDKGGVK